MSMPYTWSDESSAPISRLRYRAAGAGAKGSPAHPFWRNYWFRDYCGSDSTKSARRFAGLNQQAETETEGPGELTGAPGLLDFDHNRDPR